MLIAYKESNIATLCVLLFAGLNCFTKNTSAEVLGGGKGES